MKTALILGIQGNFGAAMAQALAGSNWQLKALVRNPKKASARVKAENLFIGDATNSQLLEQASKGVDLIVYALNPLYHHWSQLALPMLEATLAVAEAKGIHVLFPGNVYNFQPQQQAITEQSPQHPVGHKGAIRIAMEQRLRHASERGAQVTLIRAGDFIGRDAQNTWLDHCLKSTATKVKLSLPHHTEHRHFWSYLPDLAVNAVKLVEQADWQYEEFNDVGLALTMDDWQQAFAQINQPVRFNKFPWWFFYGVAPFSPMIREILKMRYLWRENVLLNGDKITQQLGAQIQQTPLAEVLADLLAPQARELSLSAS